MLRSPTIEKTDSILPRGVADHVALLAGLIGVLQFTLVGEMFATDLLLIAVLFTIATKTTAPLWKGMACNFLILGFVWFMGQLTTDLIRQSEPADLLRGWAKILFTLTNFAALYLLFLNRTSRAVLYAFGLAVGQLLKFLIRPDPSVSEDFWKWGVGEPITFVLVIAAALAFDRGRRGVSVALLTVATLANLYFNFRSVALLCFVTLCSTVLLSKRAGFTASPRRTIYLALGLVVCGFLFQRGYSYAATEGFLGESAQEKHAEQAAGDMGMILGGRAESFASLQAIADSPIIGHGSWARDARYANLLQQMYDLHGYGRYYLEDDKIPSHSHLLGAWVESGISGAIFWLWILYIATKGTLQSMAQRNPYSVLTTFCGLLLIWDVLFSPYSGARTFITPMYVILMIGVLNRRQIGRFYKVSATARFSTAPALQPSAQVH